MHDGSHAVTHGRYRKRYCHCCFKKCIERKSYRKYCNWCRTLRHKEPCWQGLSRVGRAEVLSQIASLELP